MRILVEPKNALTEAVSASCWNWTAWRWKFSRKPLRRRLPRRRIDRQIGARGLRAIMEKIMTKIMYEIPSDLTIQKVIITPEAVEGADRWHP